jgi:hypothetical protein
MKLTCVGVLIFTLLGCGQQGGNDKDSSRSFEFSYTLFEEVLRRHAAEGTVDYGVLKTNRGSLDSFIVEIGQADLSRATPSQKIVFYINVHNAIVLRSVCDAFPVVSVKEIEGMLEKKWLVAGRKYSLVNIRNEILRKEFSEPRVHIALYQSSVGSPTLFERPFNHDSLESQLDNISRRFAQSVEHNQFFPEQSVARVSSIFDWYGDDFIPQYYDPETLKHLSQKENAVLNFLFAHLPSDQARSLASVQWKVAYIDFDWTVKETE